MAPTGPRMLNTANRAAWWVPVIADINNPTPAEINAGINLTCMLTTNNYRFGITGNARISDPAGCDKVESDVPGMATAEVGFDFFRYKTLVDDIAWTTFDGAGIFGHVVERIGQIGDDEDQETAPIKAADEVSVATVLTHDQINMAPSTAGFEKFTQNFSIQKFKARVKVATA